MQQIGIYNVDEKTAPVWAGFGLEDTLLHPADDSAVPGSTVEAADPTAATAEQLDPAAAADDAAELVRFPRGVGRFSRCGVDESEIVAWRW